MKMTDPNRKSIDRKSNSVSRIEIQQYLTPSAFKDWFLDLLHVSFEPGETTFREVSSHASNKFIIAMFMIVFISAFQLLVYWLIFPINYFSLVHILMIVFWQPVSVIVIILVLFILIRRGFLSSTPSIHSIISSASMIFVISTILFTLSFYLYMKVIQPNRVTTPIIGAAIILYLILTLFAILYSIALSIICARAILPTKLWSGITLIIIWALANIMAYSIAQYSNMNILKNIFFNQWYINIGIQWMLYGILLGTLQSVTLTRTQGLAGKWFIATILGSIVGTIIYCVIIKISLLDNIISWQIQLENNIHGILITSNKDISDQLHNIIGTAWMILERSVYFLSIALAQWILFRHRVKNSILWIPVVLLSEGLYFIHSNDTLFLFVRWFMPGVVLAFIIYRMNNLNPDNQQRAMGENSRK